jgi:hypothetical protein
MNVKSLSFVAAIVATLSSTAALAADEYTLNHNLPTAVVSTSPYVAVRIAATDEYQGNQNSAAAAPSNVLRAQVIAEAIEARRLGVITEGERSPVPTAAQAEQIRLAGMNAVNSYVAAK